MQSSMVSLEAQAVLVSAGVIDRSQQRNLESDLEGSADTRLVRSEVQDPNLECDDVKKA